MIILFGWCILNILWQIAYWGCQADPDECLESEGTIKYTEKIIASASGKILANLAQLTVLRISN